jgi:DNA polymerase-3 subunit delta
MSGAFTIVCGSDDYLVAREGAERWAKICADVQDEYCREIVDGAAGTVSEAEKAVAGFIAATMTMPMFGGRKCVWLRNVSFMGETQLGRSEGAKEQFAKLTQFLTTSSFAEVGVLVTACPVDRRRKEFKQLQGAGELIFCGAEGKGDNSAVQRIVEEEVRAAGAKIGPDAVFALLDKVHASSRMAMEEARKLAVYAGEGGTVTTGMVASLVPPFGEGDFFEAVEAFFSLDLEETLAAVRRHFFAGNDIRPLLGALQNRSRLVLQLRALSDAGAFRAGMNKATLEAAAEQYGRDFPAGADKSSSNVFTQNPYYLSRLMDAARKLKPRRIIDFQMEFVRAFEEAINRPNEQEQVMCETVIRCLGA